MATESGKFERTSSSPLDYIRSIDRAAGYTPAALARKHLEYLKFMRDRTWDRAEAIRGGDAAGTIFYVKAQVMLTHATFRTFAAITKSAWKCYREAEEYAEVCDLIEDTIEAQNIEGAAVGEFNATLVARIHKIADRVESDNITRIDRVAQSPLNDLSLDQLDAIAGIIGEKS